ncbi:MAG: protein translocase subunit SecF [Caldiserica bacterium CG02_land_8_20_14_3_00_36_38]|nr:protein translocase subunit SecF [Caldisericota bacterium]OIP13746.1 MAG: protein-export membrane protein SecF [Caldisericum sp. CG2_30_36_11]PIP49328.1 MAG: protein translocase subunit SecF [Caldiserica bacterium CG23_combo_of_CG06-09_8_20_14_all_35_60]PIV54721.1 MAG: protein translocase subunit SecF [Caldiserica bacterium CG02_land_8_20_14_3_00_36_38]PIW10807.1 MAG: protein translocase subunit SecF [Caldiserica bacterium CG17_big_fil_post_rev_8_21_14_2_50_35_7]
MNFRDRISKWNIIGRSKVWFSISLAIIFIGIVAMVVNQVRTGFPLNLGIDFKGGTVINITCSSTPDTAKVSKVLVDAGYKNAIIQEGAGNKITIKLSVETIKAEDANTIIDNISKNVAPVITDQTGITSIAPVIGRELEKSGAIALGLALLFVLFYITVRFAFKFALATVLALFHDILVTLGMLALFRVELNAPFIGAFLAIITYSVEDTVVVMDRIRENLRFRGKEEFKGLVNRSITEVWVRSMNASLTTFFASFSLVFFGGPTLRDFSMTLMFGLLSGTYSSIYIASPLLVIWQKEKKPVKSIVSVAPDKSVLKSSVDEGQQGGYITEQTEQIERKNISSKKSFKKKKKSKRRH